MNKQQAKQLKPGTWVWAYKLKPLDQARDPGMFAPIECMVSYSQCDRYLRNGFVQFLTRSNLIMPFFCPISGVYKTKAGAIRAMRRDLIKEIAFHKSELEEHNEAIRDLYCLQSALAATEANLSRR